MIEKFVEENIERDVKSFELRDVIYARYLKYCKFHGLEPLTRTRFGKQLDNLNLGVKHARMRNYIQETGRQGVRLLPCKY